MQLDSEIIFKAAGLVVGSGILAGMVKLIYNCGKVISDIRYLKTTMDDDVKADLRAIRKELNKTKPEIAEIKSKVEILWRDRNSTPHSPRALNQRGKEVLRQSGVGRIVENKLTYIIQRVRARHPKNAYEAEQAIYEVVAKLKSDIHNKDHIETAAFQTGSTVDEILFVGAVYIRDKVFDGLKLKTKTA